MVRTSGGNVRGRQGASASRPINSHTGQLAEFLRSRVDESGKTLAALSKDVGYSTSQISTLLSGRSPPRGFVIWLVEFIVIQARHA
ncbi:helix-turn-helix transcriptional regulator [Streptomyces sp. NPDC051079]|uniref:helix-turn-helix domain-containing protein n=1 Tax=Streptomyces sp. NPDC051079 TaxID=3155043 RepID=UPI00344C7A87